MGLNSGLNRVAFQKGANKRFYRQLSKRYAGNRLQSVQFYAGMCKPARENAVLACWLLIYSH
jgi:hypothetical protein